EAAPWGADPRVSDDSGPRERGVRAARWAASQHLSQLAETPRSAFAPQGDAALAVRRPDHRLRGLCRERRDRPPRRALHGRRASWRNAFPAASDDGDRCALGAYHGRASLERSERGRRLAGGANGKWRRGGRRFEGALLPADE